MLTYILTYHGLESLGLAKALNMADVEPFQLAVAEVKLEQLQRKLSAASFPDELDSAAWDYGTPLADVKRLTAYWKDQFDWRKAEARINELPQFHTSIEVDGFENLNIHFVHQRSKVPQAIPLLFCHGCMSVDTLTYLLLT